ncbi:hypothetical protein [Pseudoalteromonas viridis]|uniref:Uncharacterized protein n=1 Tax=Pseudoalteromonas viridis TaxID=339617 RepID=A0ABX7V213_9GAMM|nr:hypothetical protein [Pseudoalteromonas viridis]QTL34854.1 hypothetical protein J5X90_15120 [Pseudoalteromonas viridis]
MEVGSVITAALVGNFAFDIVKTYAQVTSQFLKKAAEGSAYEWLFEAKTSDKIAARVNELSYIDGETKDAYCQRLAQDEALQSLLSGQAAQVSHGERAINQSGESNFANSGDIDTQVNSSGSGATYINSTIHTGGDTPAKKVKPAGEV